MKTRLAILGVGRWGTHLVRNFLAHPQAKVVAIADPSSDNLANRREAPHYKRGGFIEP